MDSSSYTTLVKMGGGNPASKIPNNKLRKNGGKGITIQYWILTRDRQQGKRYKELVHMKLEYHPQKRKRENAQYRTPREFSILRVT